MKKIILLVLLMSFILVGCMPNAEDGESNAVESDRFLITVEASAHGSVFYVIKDKETDVEYLYVDGSYSGTITELKR